GHRLLHIGVYASFHDIGCSWAVNVVRRRDGYRIDVLLLVQHFPIIMVKLGFRKSFHGFSRRSREIHIAECNDPFPAIDGGVSDITSSFTSSTISGEVELVTGSSIAHPSQYMSGHYHNGRGNGHVLYKISSGII